MRLGGSFDQRRSRHLTTTVVYTRRGAYANPMRAAFNECFLQFPRHRCWGLVRLLYCTYVAVRSTVTRNELAGFIFALDLTVVLRGDANTQL